jgi:adenylate cyclase
MLDRLFTAFDGLVHRYDVEKIKRVGDCYMVAAGFPGLGPTTRKRSPALRSR